MSVFTEAELTPNINPLNILDEATYLSDSESTYDVKMVSVRENSRIGAYVVQFDDLNRFAESNGVDYLTAMEAISEANEFNDTPLAVAVDEADVIANPEIVNELANVVIKPISENDPVYKFCEFAIEEYANTNDESILESIIAFDEWSKPYQDTNLMWTNKWQNIKDTPGDAWQGIKRGVKSISKHGPIGHLKNAWKVAGERDKIGRNLGVSTAVLPTAPIFSLYATADKVRQIYLAYKNKPKNIISKKIAALRSLYNRWLVRAQKEKDAKVSGIIKKVCTNIMTLIDKLLSLLQSGADKLGKF